MIDETRYVAEGKYRNLTVTVRCTTFASAVRAAKQIISHNDVIDTACVRDRKGNVLKVVSR